MKFKNGQELTRGGKTLVKYLDESQYVRIVHSACRGCQRNITVARAIESGLGDSAVDSAGIVNVVPAQYKRATEKL